MRFAYEIHRSQAANCQAPNIRCSNYDVSGEMDATSIYRVRDFCRQLMAIPGVYSVAIRNLKGGEWIEFGPVDTRNPEAAAEAVAKAQKKARRTTKVKPSGS